ncbi:MAG: radical SAM protein [Deltaproteobacteria bacterium]|nr:radical SAM protein [Deltaproteobacteria bacterium]
MEILALEPTSLCNRSCRHCLRNPADPPGSLPLEVADSILAQAETLGFRAVCLTGGEVSLYPHLEDLLSLIAARGFKLTLVTNGFKFGERLLPLLLKPPVKERVASVCFSLDGAGAATHDGLRGPKSFREVFEALLLCRGHRIPTSLKSVVTALTLNQGELTELALLGARLGAKEHEFLYPILNPKLIREGLLPSQDKLNATMRWLAADLVGALRARVNMEDGRGPAALSGPGPGRTAKYEITVNGYLPEGPNGECRELVEALYVDYLGNLVFCCTLSHVNMGDRAPTPPVRELVADLKEVPLKEGIERRRRLADEVMNARRNDPGNSRGLAATPCLWCLRWFGKLEWLRDFPQSSWAADVLDGG